MGALWYVEPDRPLPRHLTTSLGLVRLAPDAGPDGARPGGLCVAGPLEERGCWVSAGDGLWIAAERPAPEVLIRSDRPSCTWVATSWGEVPVPHLLEPDLSYAAHLVHRQITEVGGCLRVQRAIEHQELADELVRMLRTLKHEDREPDLDDDAIWTLAMRLMEAVLHVSAREIITWELLRDTDPVQIVLGAANLIASDEAP